MEPTNQGEAPKLSQVIQIDEGKIQEHLGEVVRSTVEETLNAMLDAEADRLCRAERYERTEGREDYTGRILPTAATDESGRSHAEGAEATHVAVRDGDHRTLSEARKLGGRGLSRDVSCRRECTTSRRHHRSLVGHAGEPEHGERAEPERSTDRSRGGATGRSRGTIRMYSGWLVAEAELGWRSSQLYRCWWRSA